jgi:MFS family permease
MSTAGRERAPSDAGRPDASPSSIELRREPTGHGAEHARPAERAAGEGGAGGTFDALQDPRFRWLFTSLCGTFAALHMQIFARGWLAHELTGSYASLGLVAAANGGVGLLLAPLGGVMADRVRSKKRVVQIAQLVNALNAAVIGALIYADALSIEALIVAAAVQGASMTLMMPARQALVPEVVSRGRLMNAIALNTTGMNTARLLLPGLCGFMVGQLGGGDGNLRPFMYAYWLMTALYLWSVAGLFMVRVEPRVRAQAIAAEVAAAARGRTARGVASVAAVFAEIGSGLAYIARTPVILTLLVWNLAVVLLAMTYGSLLPGYAKDVLDLGPLGVGALQSVVGVGSVVGSLAIATLPHKSRGRVLLGSIALVGIGLIGFASVTWPYAAAALLVVLGIGQAGRMTLSNVLLQIHVDDAYRGRVMSIHMLELSVMHLATWPIGVLADAIGGRWALAICGAGLLAIVAIIAAAVPTFRDLE